MDKERFKQCAKAYIELGWRVLPLCYPQEGKCTCGRGCEKPGKSPHYRLCPKGSKQATADPDIVLSWFDSGQLFNIGICAGKDSGLVIVDIDPGHGGDESLAKVTKGNSIKTPSVITGSGGQHYYFAHPGGNVRNSAGTVGAGIDVRGHNGYVVAPPSVHACGSEYRWKIDPRADLLQMPAWVTAGSTRAASGDDSGDITEGRRDNTLMSIAGRLRRVGLCSDDIYIHLKQVNKARCRPPKSDSDLRRIAKSAGRYEPGESENCIILPDDHPDTIAEAFERWSIEHCNVRHRYHGHNGWTLYKNRQYQQVTARPQIARYLSQYLRKCHVLKSKGDNTYAERVRLSDRRLADVLTQLSFLDAVYLMPKQSAPHSLDNSLDPSHIIALKNGLLDWSCYPYKLHEPTENFYTLNYLPFEWKGEKDSEMWINFLIDATGGDEQLHSLLQQWAGYCLMKHNQDEQRFMIIYGEGGTGKSVFVDVLTHLLGHDNVSAVPLDKFDDPHHVTQTYGKMLNVTDESESHLEESIETYLKHYTGGTVFPFKRMYQEPFSDYPTAKIMITTNHLPSFKDTSDGVWRRLLIAPFDNVIPQEKRIRGLARKIAATEMPGVLKWALEGARRIEKHGFIIPETCVDKLEEYRREAVPERTFFEDNFEQCQPGFSDHIEDEYRVKCDVVRNCYKRWAESQGIGVKSMKKIGKTLRKVFPLCTRKRGRDGLYLTYFYYGIRLDPDSEFYHNAGSRENY